MKTLYLYIAAAILIIGGISTFFVSHIGPEPEYTCAEEGEPTSGFVIEVDGEECPLTQEGFEALWDYDHSAVPLHRGGALAVLVGLGTGVTGLVIGHHRKKAARRLAQAGPGQPQGYQPVVDYRQQGPGAQAGPGLQPQYQQAGPYQQRAQGPRQADGPQQPVPGPQPVPGQHQVPGPQQGPGHQQAGPYQQPVPGSQAAPGPQQVPGSQPGQGYRSPGSGQQPCPR